MNILIPTDFSKLSKIAIDYILGLSRDIELNITLIHVLNTSVPQARVTTKKLEEAIKMSSEVEMRELIQTIQKEHRSKHNIRYKIVVAHYIEEAVEKFALNNDIDLICIGTKGASGLKKIFIGSNAVAIIKKSSIPVLTIPEYARYRGIDSVLYCSDLYNIEEEIDRIILFIKLLDSSIQIVHVEEESEGSNFNILSEEKKLRELFSYENISIKKLQNVSVMQGINQQVADIDAELLILFTHTTNLFEEIFQKSVTQSIAFQSRIPILTFQKNSSH
jgi:nucleotide-binding universal stress UspA family protein